MPSYGCLNALQMSASKKVIWDKDSGFCIPNIWYACNNI